MFKFNFMMPNSFLVVTNLNYSNESTFDLGVIKLHYPLLSKGSAEETHAWQSTQPRGSIKAQTAGPPAMTADIPPSVPISHFIYSFLTHHTEQHASYAHYINLTAFSH